MSGNVACLIAVTVSALTDSMFIGMPSSPPVGPIRLVAVSISSSPLVSVSLNKYSILPCMCGANDARTRDSVFWSANNVCVHNTSNDIDDPACLIRFLFDREGVHHSNAMSVCMLASPLFKTTGRGHVDVDNVDVSIHSGTARIAAAARCNTKVKTLASFSSACSSDDACVLGTSCFACVVVLVTHPAVAARATSSIRTTECLLRGAHSTPSIFRCGFDIFYATPLRVNVV